MAAIKDRLVFTVNVHPEESVTAKLSCTTGKKYGELMLPLHIMSVGMVEAAGHKSPGAQLRHKERAGAPTLVENVPTGQARQVLRLVALSVAL